MHNHFPKLLSIAGGFVLLTVGLAMGGQQELSAGSGPLRATINRATNEAPLRAFDKNFESFAPTVKKVAPAVVRIVTALKSDGPAAPARGIENPFSRYFFGQMPRVRPGRLVERGLGSGVIVTEDGYILTNSHLVDGANHVQVSLQDGREFNAKIIGLDSRSDIAVVKIDTDHLPTIPLADSRNVQVGDLVLAIGNPFGVGQTVTHGIVSATDRGGIGIEDYESFIQTDAPINPGNSGGALVDVTGHLIGINTALLSSSGGNLGIGFAVPSERARKVMADLLKHGYVVRGYFGVEAQDLTPELAKQFKLHNAKGVLVGGIVPDGPAEKAGLEVGDVITRFDGKDVRDARQLKLSVAEIKPGQVISVEVMREGSPSSLQVTISRPSRNDILGDTERSPYEGDGGPLQGVILGELNNQLRRQLQIPRNVRGAIVLGVNPFSVAAEAGLSAGDVIQSINRQEIRTAAEASRLAENATHKGTLLRVWSAGGSHFILMEH
jgi:serine protease Do